MTKYPTLIITSLLLSACDNTGAEEVKSTYPDSKPPEREEVRILPRELAQALEKVGVANAPVVITAEPSTGKIILFKKQGAREVKFPIPSKNIVNVWSTHIFVHSGSGNKVCWPKNGYQECYP